MPEKYEVQLPDGQVLSVKLLDSPIYFSITFPGGTASVHFQVQKGLDSHNIRVHFMGVEHHSPIAGDHRFEASAVTGGPSIQFSDPEPKGTEKQSPLMPVDTLDPIPLQGGLILTVGASEPRAVFSIVHPHGPPRILHFARAGHPV